MMCPTFLCLIFSEKIFSMISKKSRKSQKALCRKDYLLVSSIATATVII